MKTMITITNVGESVRMSRVTAHGEEIIVDPDLEARCLAHLLWTKLANSADMTGTQLAPWDAILQSIHRLTAAVEKTGVIAEKLEHSIQQAKVVTAAKPTPVRGQ